MYVVGDERRNPIGFVTWGKSDSACGTLWTRYRLQIVPHPFQTSVVDGESRDHFHFWP